MERRNLSSSFNGGVPAANLPKKSNFYLNPSQISLPPKPHLHDPPISPYLTADDSELSIFNAERYFNEGHDSVEASKMRSFQVTPSVSSESSWNSQAGLLKTPPSSLSDIVKSSPAAEQKKASSSPKRRLFRHGCPCSGKKSVNVEQSYTAPKTPIRSSFDTSKDQNLVKSEQEVEKITKVKIFPGVWPKEQEPFRFSPDITRRTVNSGGFSFPILAPPMPEFVEDPARDSLEVFQPIDGASSPVLKTFDRRSFIIPGSPKPRGPVEDDLASDASSDLFEIESLSTQMNSRRRDSVDELSSLGFEPKKNVGTFQLRRSIEEECYPPSEVSVQWSVTTAEGFDRASAANFSSAVSEFNELRFDSIAGEGRKRGVSVVGGLLSCRSEKAVCAVTPHLKRFEPDEHRKIGSSIITVEPDRVGCCKPASK